MLWRVTGITNSLLVVAPAQQGPVGSHHGLWVPSSRNQAGQFTVVARIMTNIMVLSS